MIVDLKKKKKYNVYPSFQNIRTLMELCLLYLQHKCFSNFVDFWFFKWGDLEWMFGRVVNPYMGKVVVTETKIVIVKNVFSRWSSGLRLIKWTIIRCRGFDSRLRKVSRRLNWCSLYITYDFQ